MNGDLTKYEASYELAEQKAKQYLQLLCEQVKKEDYVATLTNDLQLWKQKHIHFSLPFFSRGKEKPDSQKYYDYIQWLHYRGKLEHYLDRSISYIYMRDLGKALDSPHTQARIRHVVASLKKTLTSSTREQKNKLELFSMASLYRLAEKEGIESTFFWLINKLQNVSDNLPQGLDEEHAKRKLIKIIAGVIMHELEEMGENVAAAERAQRLDQAIRLGYSYGLTYPFIDDLLDSNVLSAHEKKQYSHLIHETLITGAVPELGEWAEQTKEWLGYIHSELKEAFMYIKAHQHYNFFEQAYVFFQAQEMDRVKDLANEQYINEEIYIPIILKSSSSRLIARSMIGATTDEGFEERTFFYGIYNQLADDFADMFDDLKNGIVTPYTYYMKHEHQRQDLINPFELYWAVISHLIHHVYHSDAKTREVILARAINGLKRFKERMGVSTYNEVMELFSLKDKKFSHLIQKMVDKADDVDFFDKLLRDQMITNLKKERVEQEDFLDTIKEVRKEINAGLAISKSSGNHLIDEPIVAAANYSLAGDGKRLRPIITWIMAVNKYGLKTSEIMPLLRALEYMHTASLILDDLPSQDNASVRRGRPTLHEVHNSAIAELTSLFLTQKAMSELASLDQFAAKKVLKLIHYSALITAEMCKGQALDLESKGKRLTLEQLNSHSFYKTGLGFEAALVMPAMLADAGESEIVALKKIAYHAGIAFQIKDDLLDVEGDQELLGKAIGKDAENNTSTFVSILGVDGARKAMWEHYCHAIEMLQELQGNHTFLKHLLNYIVKRTH